MTLRRNSLINQVSITGKLTSYKAYSFNYSNSNTNPLLNKSLHMYICVSFCD